MVPAGTQFLCPEIHPAPALHSWSRTGESKQFSCGGLRKRKLSFIGDFVYIFMRGTDIHPMAFKARPAKHHRATCRSQPIDISNDLGMAATIQ